MAKDDITAFLGAGTIYNGRLKFVGSVRIDGQFTGEIHSDGTLILGKDAMVEGTICVCHLVLSGNLHGDVTVSEKSILHKTANLTGNLTTRTLIIEEGAMLQGTICMDPTKASATKTGMLDKTVMDDSVQEVELQ